MLLIRPTTITDTEFVSCTIPETDYSAWVSGTTYALGDRVIRTSTHRIYESLQSSNLGNTPETSPTWWIEVSATNRWKQFDNITGSQASATGNITTVLTPGRIDSISFFNLDATSLQVTMVDGVDTVYDATVDLQLENVLDWYQYFFEPIITRSAITLTDLPQYGSAELTISIDKGTSTVKVGEIVVGLKRNLGISQYGARSGIIDYSRKETDEFGNATILERTFSKRLNIDVYVDKVLASEVYRLLAQYRATPVVWVGDINLPQTILYGFFRDFDIVLEHFSGSMLSIEIEGLS